jgi:hypothetical protein
MTDAPPTSPNPTLEAIRNKLRSATGPLKFTELKRALPNPTKIKPAKAFDGEVQRLLDAEVQEGRVFTYPIGGPKPTAYWGTDAAGAKAAIEAAVVTAAETPKTEAALAKVAFAADQKLAKTVVKELIATKRLHKHPGNLLGKHAPPALPPLEQPDNAKKLKALVASVKKLLDAAKVTPEVLLTVLRGKLIPAENATVPPVVVPPPFATHEPLAELTTERIRRELKSAYDELRNDVEGEDGAVEIRLLYHEAKKTLPDLSVAAFHRALQVMQQERALELHALNEVKRAQERHLAIEQNDRLLYFVLWGK